MKKILITSLIFIIYLYIAQCSFVLAQSTSVKYSNIAIQTYNSGVALHKEGKYELAEQKYNQTLKLQPDFIEAKKNLAMVYQNLAYQCYGKEAYDKSISYAKESISFQPENVNVYNILGQSYLALNNYEKASEIYKKILSLNPNDSVALQNLKYIDFKRSDKLLNESINNLKIAHTAPEELYRLITPQSGVDYIYVEKMKVILDLIWSESSGKILLSALLKNHTPINITNGYAKANAFRTKQTHTFYLYWVIPIASFTTNSSVSVNIPFSHIDNFNNTNIYALQRIYNLQVFIHEFGHAFIGIKNPKDVNSIEEEIGVSMIGYNIANKIITDKYLDSAEIEKYSIACLEGLLLDEHKDLPIYSGFNKKIQKYGILMPYPEIYSNIPLMYKKLLAEKKVNPTPSFNAYLK